jgi:hypothetical protein
MPYDQSTFGTLLYGVKGVGYPIRYANSSGGVGIFRGGGIRGLAPMPVIGVNNDSDFEMTRITLREVWNNTPLLIGSKFDRGKYPCTPFRKKMNAGDILSRLNYSCGGSCQTPQSIPGIPTIRNSIGSIQNKCDESFNPPSSCNVKYVYDSSDYTRFLKNSATNKNYNDLSYGGDQNNASFTTIQAMRHF